MKKILIIEDDLDLLSTLALLLEGEGNEVWKFKKGKPAIEKMKKLMPDVLVIDLMLPDVGGDSVARYVRQDESLKNKRIIMISADVKVANIAKESGADEYLVKPFTIDRLLSLL